MVKLKIRLRRFVKGVSPVLAVLLMIAIAVIAAIVAYFWVMGYFRSTTNKLDKAILIQGASHTGNYLLIYAQNIGQETLRFIPSQCLYVNAVLQPGAAIDLDTLEKGKTATINSRSAIALNQPIKIKVVADDGTFAEGTFTITEFTGEYTLRVNVIGGGNVSRNPDKTTYLYGTGVQLTASPNIGWSFSGWTGHLTGSINPASITMDDDKVVNATFTPIEYTFDVVVDPVSGGSVSKVPDKLTYHYGDVVQLTASANPDFTFSEWTGSLTGSSNPDSITVDGNEAVTAHFTGAEYTLNVNIVGSGSVSKSPEQVIYHYGDVVQLTAIPDVGWTFSSWNGDLSGNTNPASITIDGSKTVTATFTQNEYTLTVNYVGNGIGTVTETPNQATYHYGDSVRLTAAAFPDSYFAEWGGDLTGSVNPVNITMNGNKLVDANFTLYEYTLTINTVGSGAVAKGPDQTTYHYSDVVQLTANPTAGWSFQDWTGDLTGSTNPASILINGDKTVTANFTQNEYTLTINVIGNGAGSVAKNPDQLTYHYGDIVQLTATVDAGSYLAGWGGDMSGTANPDNVTIDGSKTVTANFTLYEYTLTVNIVGNGTVDRSPDRATYHYGDMVQLIALSGDHWSFSAWSGDLTGNTNPANISIDGGKTVNATFILTQFQITFNQTDIGSGFADTVIVIDGANYGVSVLPVSFWWDNQSIHTFAFQSPLIVGSGDQYNWASTTGLSTLQSGSITVSTSGSVTGIYVHQVLDHFAFGTISSPQMAGTTFSITITAKDATGDTVTSYTGTNTLTDSTGTINPSSTGTFVNGVWTGSVTITKATIGVTISTSGSGKSGVSNPFNVNAGALHHFTITGYPTSVTAYQSFGGVTVTAYDAYSNVKTDYTGQVYFTSTDGAADLPYTSGSRYTFVSGDNGVHTFLGFTLKTTGSMTITVTNGTESATTSAINVVANDYPRYQTSISPNYTAASVTTSYTYTITKYYGSTHLGWASIQVPVGFTAISVTSATYHIGSSSGSWDYSVSGNTITVHDYNGNHELGSNGDYVVVVFSATAPASPGTYGPFTSTVYEHYNKSGSGPGTLYGSDPTVNVYVPGVLDHFTITGYPSSRTAGQDFDTNNVVVRAYDGGNNILTGYTGLVYFASTDSQAILPYTSGSKYTFVSGDNGVHTFAGTGFTLKTAGSQTITVTDGSVSATSNSITVNPNTASKLVYTAGAGQSLIVGQVSAQITVQRQDQYGNPTTTGSITVNLASSSGTGRFYRYSDGTSQVTTRTISDGSSSASFYYRDTTAGTPTLTTSYSGLTSATTQFTIQLPKATSDIASSFTPHSGIQPGNQVTDTAKLVNATADAGGSFTYKLYSGIYPSGTQIDSDTKTVTNGVVPDSKAFTVPTQGPYYFINEYSGDSKNNGITTYSPESFVAWPLAQTVLLRPSGDTDDNHLGTYGASTHYQCVNQVSSDGDTTYVDAATTGYWTDDTYQLPNLAFTTGTINYVTIHAVARTTGYGSTQLSLTTHGSEFDGSENPGYAFPLTSSWLEYTAVWSKNPSTGSTWTIQEINDLLVGCSLYETTGDAKCTQVYVEVYYTP